MPTPEKQIIDEQICAFSSENTDPQPSPQGIATRAVLAAMSELDKASPGGYGVIEASDVLGKLSLLALTLQNNILRAKQAAG